MEKKIYEKPVAQEERFVPNHYASLCQGEGYTIWTAKCRDNGSCLIFFDDGDWTNDANRGGCGGTHQFKVTDADGIPQANCWLMPNVTISSSGHWPNITYSVSPSSYAQYFTGTITYGTVDHGRGLTIKPEFIESLKGSGELVRGYYNSECLGSSRWLVTDKPSDMKQMS